MSKKKSRSFTTTISWSKVRNSDVDTVKDLKNVCQQILLAPPAAILKDELPLSEGTYARLTDQTKALWK